MTIILPLLLFDSEGISLQDMLNELEDVIVEWFKLGVYLKVPSATLKAIRSDSKRVEECKLFMLIEWSKYDTPTWEKLVTALIHIDMPSVAVKIATKHRKFREDNF